MKQLPDLITELRRPFTPEAVQFKIQAVKKKGLLVAYIDARQTAERLNTVCPAQWSDSYREIVDGGGVSGVECSITVLNPAGSAIIRTDVGISEGGIGGLKAVYSDAFKRAGVKLGIGVGLYYTPKCFVAKSLLNEFGGKFYMTDEATAKARDQYSAWLNIEGVKRFGEPLDLGDTLDSQGDIETLPDSHPDTADGPEAKAQEPIKPKMPRASKDPQANTLRNAYRDYIARHKEDVGETEAKKQFGLWLAANNLPSELASLDTDQAEMVQSFLLEG